MTPVGAERERAEQHAHPESQAGADGIVFGERLRHRPYVEERGQAEVAIQPAAESRVTRIRAGNGSPQFLLQRPDRVTDYSVCLVAADARHAAQGRLFKRRRGAAGHGCVVQLCV